MSARWAAVAGAVFFVLVLINANQMSGAPSATDSARETFSYLVRHQARFQLSAVIWGFAMCASLVWLSGLFRTLRRAERGTARLALVALAGGVLAAASTVTGALIEGTTATRIGDLGPAGARVGWTMYLMSIGATLFGLLLLLGATAFVCLRRQLFARWFAVATGVLALVSGAGAFTIGYASTGIQAVAGIAVVLDTAWILTVSFFLWRDPALAQG
ncbi:MAG: hypothetical protein ACXVFN_01995 [Solirubrobacteraceae bacterium]